MLMITGLGNPEKQYERTRHNAGFLVLDNLRKMLGFPAFQKKPRFFAETSEGLFDEKKVILVKPQTFMNLSGKAVAAVAKYYKVKPKDLWVIYDDVDLPEGKIRIRKNGSAGTHNGMKSVIDALKHEDIPRFRLGVRKTKMPKDLSAFILSEMTGETWKKFQNLTHEMAKIVDFALKHGIEKTMNTYNRQI